MMMPGVPVHVHDAYIAGKGQLHAAVFGLITVARVPDSLELQRGELMIFFMEGAWYPTALLPGQGVRWEGVDDQSAQATMNDGVITPTQPYWRGTINWLAYELRTSLRTSLQNSPEWLQGGPSQSRLSNAPLRKINAYPAARAQTHSNELRGNLAFDQI